MPGLEDDERLVLEILSDGVPRSRGQILAYANELAQRHGSCAAAADELERQRTQKH